MTVSLSTPKASRQIERHGSEVEQRVYLQPLRRNVQWFRGRLVFKAHRLVYHSTLCSRVIKKKKLPALDAHGGVARVTQLKAQGPSGTCNESNKEEAGTCAWAEGQLEAGSYLRLIHSCITQLKAQGPSRTCNESKEEVTCA